MRNAVFLRLCPQTRTNIFQFISVKVEALAPSFTEPSAFREEFSQNKRTPFWNLQTVWFFSHRDFRELTP